MTSNAKLTFDLEALAYEPTTPELVTQLVEGLQHPVAFVREGAIYGCAGHLGSAVVREALADVAEADPEDDIREIARNALEISTP